MAIPVVIIRLDDDNQPIGDPIEVITRDVSPTSIGFFHTQPLEAHRLAVKLRLAETEVNLVVLMEWHADAGPFYGMSGMRYPQGFNPCYACSRRTIKELEVVTLDR